jgi:hypothetical protein
MLRSAVLIAALLAAATRLDAARFHELPDNRATLVLRDRTHVSVTMYVSYADALHRALAPQQPMTEFVLAYSAMAPDVFARELRKAHARFAATTVLATSDGTRLALTNWKWPEAARVQGLLREQTMQALVAPGEHGHETPTEIRAEAVAATPVTSVTMRFPAEFQRVLVVSYKPNQVWVDPAKPAPRIVF